MLKTTSQRMLCPCMHIPHMPPWAIFPTRACSDRKKAPTKMGAAAPEFSFLTTGRTTHHAGQHSQPEGREIKIFGRYWGPFFGDRTHSRENQTPGAEARAIALNAQHSERSHMAIFFLMIKCAEWRVLLAVAFLSPITFTKLFQASLDLWWTGIPHRLT